MKDEHLSRAAIVRRILLHYLKAERSTSIAMLNDVVMG
jgi:hypothetical protein